MVRIHKKKSKRMTCRKKYKIIRKVAEHNRKVRRDKKKNPSKYKQKDPGVPNSLPFKEEILNEAQQRKARAAELKEARKAARLEKQNENRFSSLEEMAKDAEDKDADFDSDDEEIVEKKEEKKMNVLTHKSYFKELKRVVEDADVILEVLDARDPLGSRCPQIEELVLNSGKKLVLVLNKIDLIPKSNIDAWLAYLRKELPTVAFKSSTQIQNRHLGHSKVAAIHINENLQNSSKCVGGSFLMKVLGNYCRRENIKMVIKVGVVGFPNTGKSSVINSLKRARTCTVSSEAGMTKAVQEVALDRHIKLLDSPGVVMARDGDPTTLALRNAVKIENLKDVMTPAEAILQRADLKQLCIHYTIPEFSSSHELFGILAKRLGRFKKGGVPNIEEGARRLINDWNRGIIKYYTHPPETYTKSEHLDAVLVAEMGKAFDISEMEERMELDKLQGVKSSRCVPSNQDKLTSIRLNADEENMDCAEMTVEFKNKDPNAQKEAKVEWIPKELQKNRTVKKIFKKLQKKRRKSEKKAVALSDSMNAALNLNE